MKSILILFLSVFLQTGETVADCDALILQGVQARIDKEYAQSFELLTKAKTLAEKNQWHKQQFLAINNLGANFYTLLDYGEALNHYLEAYTIAIKELDGNHEMIVLNNIAILYSKEKQHAKAEEYFKKAYDIARQKGENLKVGLYAVNLGIVANEQKQSQKAKTYLNKAIPLLQENKTILLQAEIALAENYFQREEYLQAKELATAILPQLKEDTFPENRVQVLLLLANIEHAGNNTVAAIALALQALEMPLNVENKLSVYERLSFLYAENKEPLLALQAKDSVVAAIEALHHVKNGRLFETNKAKFEIQSYQQALKENQEKQRVERRWFYLLFGFAIFTIILIAWALRNSFIKNKQRKIIDNRTRENMTLALEKEKTDNLLLENQLKEKETLALLEREQLKNEIEFKNRKLAAKALHLSNRNELIEQIINSISAQPEVYRNRSLTNYIKQLKGHLKNDTEWENFLKHFEEVNQGILIALKEKHPQLTSNDLRFLSYMYMNLSTKEISLLLHITPEACRKRKERISKKMELPEEIDLYNYISSI